MDSRFARWAAGLAILAGSCLVTSAGLAWWAAALFHEMDVFYRTSSSDTQDPAVVRYYDTIASHSYAMSDTVVPMLMGAVLAVLALLVVLALRWEREAGRAT